MNVESYVDERGYKHRVLVSNDGDIESGITQDPPDILSLDWEAIKRDLHNELLEHRVINFSDVQSNHNILSRIVKTVLVKRLVMLYKERQ